MNSPKILEHLDAIRALLTTPAPTEADWAEYGRAVAEAVAENPHWRPPAVRLWHAAGKVGLH